MKLLVILFILKHSSKYSNRCLFIVSKLDIIWSSWKTRELNFKQVFSFLVWNIYFTFFLSVVDWTFYKSNCILLLCHVRVRSSRQEVFCKKGILWNFAKFTGLHLCYSLFFKKESLAQMFSCEFCEISKKSFSYRTPPVNASGVLEWIYTLQY